jgi:hypothetical protein
VATETQTRSGRCTSHGEVEGTRDMPGTGFPWIYHAVKRMMARQRPFRCPNCGEPIETG